MHYLYKLYYCYSNSSGSLQRDDVIGRYTNNGGPTDTALPKWVA